MADETVEGSSLEKLENAWSKVFITEFIVIAIINAFTLVALQELTTYASALRI